MNPLMQALDDRDEYRIRLYGVLWMLVEDEVISESKARELARMSIAEFRKTNRDPRLEGAARALLTRKDLSPSEDAHIFAEWDDLRDALE